jgi:hypothetical protein
VRGGGSFEVVLVIRGLRCCCCGVAGSFHYTLVAS